MKKTHKITQEEIIQVLTEKKVENSVDHVHKENLFKLLKQEIKPKQNKFLGIIQMNMLIKLSLSLLIFSSLLGVSLIFKFKDTPVIAEKLEELTGLVKDLPQSLWRVDVDKKERKLDEVKFKDKPTFTNIDMKSWDDIRDATKLLRFTPDIPTIAWQDARLVNIKTTYDEGWKVGTGSVGFEYDDDYTRELEEPNALRLYYGTEDDTYYEILQINKEQDFPTEATNDEKIKLENGATAYYLTHNIPEPDPEREHKVYFGNGPNDYNLVKEKDMPGLRMWYNLPQATSDIMWNYNGKYYFIMEYKKMPKEDLLKLINSFKSLE